MPSLFQEAEQELARAAPQARRPSLFDEVHQEMAPPVPSIFEEAHRELYSPELPRILMDAREGAPPPEALQEAREAKRALRASGDREGAKSLQYHIKTTLQPAIRNAKRAEREATKRGIDLPEVEQNNTTTMERLLNGIDKPGRAVRSLANSAFGDEDATLSGVWNNKQGDAETYLKHMRESTHPVAASLHKIASVPGKFFGRVGGTLAAGAGALADIAQGEMPSLENFQKTIADSEQAGTEFVELMGADPTTYITGGTASGPKQLFGQALRVGKEAGLTRQAAKAFAKEAFQHAPAILGDMHQGEKLAALAAKHGVKPELAALHFGAQGEVAGKRGISNVMESIRSRQEGFRPSYQKQAIRQKVGELRRGAQQNQIRQAAEAVEKGRVTSLESAKELSAGLSEAERGNARVQFEEWATKMLGDASPQAEMFGPAARELAPAVKKEMQEYFAVGMKGLEGGPLSPLMDHWRAVNLTGRGGYHILNMMGDSAMALGAGLKDPRLAWAAIRALSDKVPDSAVLLKTKTGQEWTAGALRAELKRIGAIKHQAMGQVDMDVVPSARKLHRMGEVQKLQAAGKPVRAYLRNTPEVLKDVASMGAHRVGAKVSNKWDELFKSTMFLHFLQEGESVANATAKTFGVAFDYSDPGRFPQALNTLRKFFPTIGWQYRAATQVPAMVARNPKMATVPLHATQALASPEDNSAPSWMREKGMSYELPGQSPGERLRAALREPVTDVANTYLNPANALGMLQPFAKPFIEGAQGRDLLQGKDIGKAFKEGTWDPNWGVFHQGAAGDPSLESSGQTGALSDYADLVLGAPWLYGANKINEALGYEPLLGKPAKDQDMKFLNSQTGLNLYPTTPGTGTQELVHRPEVQRAAKSKGALKKLKKKSKETGK